MRKVQALAILVLASVLFATPVQACGPVVSAVQFNAVQCYAPQVLIVGSAVPAVQPVTYAVPQVTTQVAPQAIPLAIPQATCAQVTTPYANVGFASSYANVGFSAVHVRSVIAAPLVVEKRIVVRELGLFAKIGARHRGATVIRTRTVVR